MVEVSWKSGLSSLLDASDRLFWLSFAWIIINPLAWNLVARREYKKHTLTKLFGDKYVACYFLAVCIFIASSARDYVFKLALEEQPKIAELNSYYFVTVIPYTLAAIGLVLVLTSFWTLGITGTFLGDYFGILLKDKIDGFPFNVFEHPMYTGSTLIFFASAFSYRNLAGFILATLAWVCYQVAARYFEGPFTSKIYANAARAAAARSLSPNGKRTSSASPPPTTMQLAEREAEMPLSPRRASNRSASASEKAAVGRSPSRKKRQSLLPATDLDGTYWQKKSPR